MLYARWGLEKIELPLGKSKIKTADPIICDVLGFIIVSFTGKWAGIQSHFEVLESSLPLDFDEVPLSDYVPDANATRPDGTSLFRDENREIPQVSLPPEVMNELEMTGAIRQVYKVLIKGPWQNVKQDYWKLSEDQVKKFVDEDGIAYAFAHFEGKDLQYALVVKDLWDRFDEIVEKARTSGLSDRQLEDLIKGLLSG